MDTLLTLCLFLIINCQLCLSSVATSPTVSADQSILFVQEPPDLVDFSNSTGTRILCAATGSPPPVITWLVADGNQVTNVSGLRQVNVDGTLVFPPFRAEDYRQDVHTIVYRCVASNPIGTIISRDVNVRAVVLQPYDVYVYDVYVIKGNTAVFRCHVPSFLVDYVKVTSWVRDSAFVIQSSFADDGKYIVMPTGELYVRDVGPNDAMTTFRCQTQHRLTGEVKMSATAGRLFVTEPQGKVQPRVTDSKTSIKATLHETVVLPCIAQGHPVPAPKWFTKVANGHLLPVYVGDRIHQPNGALVIRDAQVADSGTYVCVISNNASSERIETSVAITAPLTVEVQPSMLMGELGKAATFRCHVSSFPITSLYWLKDGRPLPMPGLQLPTTETVLVEAVRLTDRGMFQCMAKRGFESAQGIAELKIGDISPAFRAVFEERILQPGPGLTLQCVTYGSPKPQVTWTLDSLVLPEGNERASIRDHVDAGGNVVSRLTVARVRPEDGGIYKCSSSNLAGNIEHSTRINIYGRPGVRSRPKMTAVAGDNVMLSCPMYGYPIDMITWEKDGVILPINLRQTVLPNGTLVVEKIQRATDSGKYTCLVQNKQGQSARGDVEVVVMVRPKIIPFAFLDDQFYKGMRAHVTCAVSQGDLPMRFGWQKDGWEIPPELGVVTRNYDQHASSLTIENVSSEHTGNYTCVASNAAATVQYMAPLLVHVPPRWIIEPKDSSAVRGETAMLHCKADGFPAPEISWMKAEGTSPNAERKPIESSYEAEVLYNGTLLIRQSEQTSDGFYFCRAANGVGEGLSKVVRLVVHVPTHFQVRFHNHTGQRGEDVRLKCDAGGDLPIAITWRFGGESIDQRVDPRYKITETRSEDGVHSEFMIHNTERKDTGTYSCLGANKYGSDEIKLQLTVQEPPDPPRITKLESVGNRSVHLTWSEPFDGNNKLTKYTIQYKSKLVPWDNESVPPNMTIDGSKVKAIVRGLYPATTYHFRLFAENTVGRSVPSDIGTVDIEEEPPGNPPRQVEVEASDPQTLRVTWKPPQQDPWTSNIRGYYIGYKIYNSTDPYNYYSLEVPEDYADDLVFRITDLRMYSQYSVTVQAYNDRGRGPNSPDLLVMTSEDVPNASPTDVSCSVLTSQSVNVNWQLLSPHAVNGILRGYKVLFKPADEWYDPSISMMTTTSNKLTLQNLEKSANYSIQVLAFTRVGEGPKSDPVYCKTYEDVPGPPTEIKAIPTSLDSVLVAWKPPSRPNGAIIRYNVYIRDAADSTHPMGGEVHSGGHTVPRSEEYLDATKFAQTGEGTTYEIKGLKKNRRYEFWVTAATAVGEGQSTRVVAQSPSGPLVVATAASFSDIITTPWKREIRLQCLAVGMPLPFRKWISRGRTIKESRKVRILSDGTLILKDVDRADAGNYTCIVQNKLGDDKITYMLTIQVPPSTSTLTVVSTSLTAIELQWKPEPEETTPVSGYILHFKREFGQWESIDLKGDQLSYRLESLWCGTRYLVYIQGYNKIGVGTPSEILTATTEGSVPEVPNKETLLKEGPTFVTISLEGWPVTGCPIMYFVVEYKHISQLQWILVSNNAKPEQRKVVVPGLHPGTWYTLKVTAHSSAGSAVAKYNFATLTLAGGTVGPEVMIEIHEEKGVLFYLDLRIMIPIAISLLVLFVALLAMCIFFRRQNHGDHHLIKGRIINGIVKSSSKFSSTSSTGKNYSVDSFGNGQRSSDSIARRYPSISEKLVKGSGEEITPYATTQLPNFHYGEMKTFGERKSGAGPHATGGGSDTEDTQKRSKKSSCDSSSRPKSDGAVVAAYPRPEPDGKAAWATGQPERSFSSRTAFPVGQSRSTGRTSDSSGCQQQSSPGDTKWRIVQRNLGNISKAKVHGVGSGSTTQETTFIFPKTPDEGGIITSAMQSDVTDCERYDEPIPPPSAFQSKIAADSQGDATEGLKLLKRTTVSSKNK